MSCLIARVDETFEELLSRPAVRRVSNSRPSFMAANLFDLSVKPIQVAKLDPRIRREEDAERWDGLS
jgi:hypothetical protein